MTGAGTNSYLLGRQHVALIDPGPAEASHIDAILSACGDQLRWILVTHTHRDHSPAAAALAAATGAEVIGMPLQPDDGFQDNSFVATRTLTHDERLVSDEFTLRAIYTPGHVNNHICYLFEEQGLLFCGDHIMQGSTVVIIPPHGDMKAYIESLRLLLDYPLQALAPGHGWLIDDPVAEVQGLIDHRLTREAKVLQVLKVVGKGTLKSLTPKVYDDVNASLHPIARYSLWAHLIKLQHDGVASVEGDDWCFVG
jgi:glyoxylase-like metal-dependent hydrolase (beta-lactamase superfamily II)